MNGLARREREWLVLRARAQEVTDLAGTRIDAGILDTVVALWAHGFGTDASCEGHLDSEAFPSVMITVNSDEEEPVDGSPPLNEGARKNLELQRRLFDLLDEFYRDRRPPIHTMLVTADLPTKHGFTLQPQGSYVNWLREGDERREVLQLYQKEMRLFTEFLKTKFFEKS